MFLIKPRKDLEMVNKKYFIITVDTEGDDLWSWSPSKDITTRCSKFIPRFQELCERYSFIPVYLTNYEMALDDFWVDYGKKKQQEGKCEIGMHLHAWNSPPLYSLTNVFGSNPYITEYPLKIVRKKVCFLKTFLEERFDSLIVSHRSGRWSTNQEYLEILVNNGILVDCSFTPGLDLSYLPGFSKMAGSNYRRIKHRSFFHSSGIYEIPMSTFVSRKNDGGSFKHRLKTLFKGNYKWLRPINISLKEMIDIVNHFRQSDYIEFMIHSSELMPGGSPYFKDEEEIEELYNKLDSFFSYLAKKGYIGVSLKDFYELKTTEKKKIFKNSSNENS